MNSLSCAMRYSLLSAKHVKDNFLSLGISPKSYYGYKCFNDTQAKVFSKILDFPERYFTKDWISINYGNFDRRLKNFCHDTDSYELEYMKAVATICYNTVYMFIVERYSIPEFNKDSFKFDLSMMLRNCCGEAYYCKKNVELTQGIVSSFREKLGLGDMFLSNVYGIIESRGILVFSFRRPTLFSYNQSFHIFMGGRPFVFVRDDMLGTASARECILYELFSIICELYDKDLMASPSLCRLFAREMLLNEMADNYIMNMNIYNYEDICKLVYKLGVSVDSILWRYSMLKAIEIPNYIKVLGCINEYYHNVFIQKEDKKNEKFVSDESLIFKKLNRLFEEDNISAEYISNVVSLPRRVINELCFNMFDLENSTVEKKMNFV